MTPEKMRKARDLYFQALEREETSQIWRFSPDSGTLQAYPAFLSDPDWGVRSFRDGAEAVFCGKSGS